MDKEALREQLKVILARNSLAAFILYNKPAYMMGWVHEEVCRKMDEFLEAVQEKKSPRLIIMLPPRSGKSEIVSRMFPAYAFGRYPDISIIGTSYSADLASRNNRDVQRVMESDAYSWLFPAVKLPTKGNVGYTRTSDLFEIPGYAGSYRSAGVGGGLTGMGSSIACIDDPIKDRAEADSPTYRNKVYDWYTSTLYTRLAPGGGIILIQTRWHEDDLAGRLIAAMNKGEGERWEVVSYPAIATHDEEFRKEGEALHPERYSLEQLENIRNAIGSRDWAALYQQSPTPAGGTIVREEWLKTYTQLPNNFEQLIQSWDMTFKGADTSDYVVGQVWGRRGADCYLVDQYRGRWSFTETIEKVIEATKKYPKALRKLVEDKANGPAVIDVLKHSVQGIIPVTPDGSKTARLYAVTPMMEAGNVYIPAPEIAPWVREYREEMLMFPAGAHDDQVDATTQALRDLQQHSPININPALLRRRFVR